MLSPLVWILLNYGYMLVTFTNFSIYYYLLDSYNLNKITKISSHLNPKYYQPQDTPWDAEWLAPCLSDFGLITFHTQLSSV